MPKRNYVMSRFGRVYLRHNATLHVKGKGFQFKVMAHPNGLFTMTAMGRDGVLTAVEYSAVKAFTALRLAYRQGAQFS